MCLCVICACMCVWCMYMVYMDVCGIYVCAYGVCDLYVCIFQFVSIGMCLGARVEVWRQPWGQSLPSTLFGTGHLCLLPLHTLQSSWLESFRAFSCLCPSSPGRSAKNAGTCFTCSGIQTRILSCVARALPTEQPCQLPVWLNRFTKFSQKFRQGNRISTRCV